MSQYRVLGGVSGVFTVPDGAFCVGIAAFVAPGVANGSIQVGADPAVPIPTGGSQSLSPPIGYMRGPATITFANTSGYGVEIIQ